MIAKYDEKFFIANLVHNMLLKELKEKLLKNQLKIIIFNKKISTCTAY